MLVLAELLREFCKLEVQHEDKAYHELLIFINLHSASFKTIICKGIILLMFILYKWKMYNNKYVQIYKRSAW